MMEEEVDGPPPIKMASFSLHCQAELHDLCPNETDVMYCVCDCHDGSNGNRKVA